jgi:hypothetical protein
MMQRPSLHQQVCDSRSSRANVGRRAAATALALATLALGLSGEAAYAGKATASGEVVSPAQFRDGLDWYAAHRANILKAANARIVENRGGGRFVLETTTQLGPSRYLVEETSELGAGRTIIRIKHKQRLTGHIGDQSMTVTLTPHDEQTRVQLSLSARIDHPLAFDAKVKQVLDASIAGTVKYLENPPANP